MAFCELLVNLKVCEEITISFLPVGHTHEDIDQFFSRLAVLLRRTDALSLEHLGKIIPSSYKTREGQRPKVIIWNTLANISDWLVSEANGNPCKTLDGITRYNSFKIEMGSNRRPVLRARTRMSLTSYGDEYRGIQNKDPLPYPLDSSTCFPDREKALPDLLRDAREGLIPDCQRTEQTHERLERHAKGLEDLNKLSFQLYPSEHRNSNQALLLMEFPDFGERLKFDWQISDIEELLDQLSEDPPDDPKPEEAKFAEPKCAIKMQKSYIIMPYDPARAPKTGAKGNTIRGDNWPFYIGVVKDTVKPIPEHLGEAFYHVQFMEPATEGNGDEFRTLEEWLDTKYQISGNEAARLADHAEVPASQFLQELSLTGKRKKMIARQGNHGRTACLNWGIRLGKGRNVKEGFSDYKMA